ncbi:hypothetical protein BYT27DRAFT_7078032, partial [Phlegmacium glaucopus]
TTTSSTKGCRCWHCAAASSSNFCRLTAPASTLSVDARVAARVCLRTLRGHCSRMGLLRVGAIS